MPLPYILSHSLQIRDSTQEAIADQEFSRPVP